MLLAADIPGGKFLTTPHTHPTKVFPECLLSGTELPPTHTHSEMSKSGKGTQHTVDELLRLLTPQFSLCNERMIITYH